MEKNQSIEYYILLEQLLSSMTTTEWVDLEAIRQPLSELCRMFRISKCVAEFYDSIVHEKEKDGDIFVCYDNGDGGSEVISRRLVTRCMTVAKCIVYMSDGTEPLSESERETVDLIIKTILSFISRSRLQLIVERLTFHDDNGYRNLRAFMRYLEQQSVVKGLGGMVAIQFNLKHFSLVNREVGTKAGDKVIRGYYTMLEQIIGDSGIVCRMGGDNFVAVFDDALLPDVLLVLNGVPVLYDERSSKRIMVAASAGVFCIPEGYVFRGYGEIMDKILSSSQEARTGGKDSIVFFNSDMELNKEHMKHIHKSFPKALENGEFKVFYQPKIDIDSGLIVGAEALCRWQRDGEIVPPADFIPALEQNTDICRLDFYMLDCVCRDIRRWIDEGRNAVRVSVNFSRKHMMDVDLIENIIRVIDSHKIPHDYIEIELTETTADADFRDLKRVVSGLHDAGVYTSVDDFGMGYSSLNLIREIPWNILKVDRSFLPLDDENEKSARSIMFRYVVAMARDLGLECIAEGVETKKQIEVLRDNGCTLAQGFYFDKPLPMTEFEGRLNTHSYNISASDQQ